MTAPSSRLRLSPDHSTCPIGASVEILGDRWSLILLRDITMLGHTTFNGLLRGSLEGISPSVLSQRLHRMTELGLLSRTPDPTHSQKEHYRPTPAAVALLPALTALARWGTEWLPGIQTWPQLEELLAGGDAAQTKLAAELNAQMNPPA